ncbi:ferredoxin [Catellatospora aurea]|uniref:Ferredoxin n=1 Tax=Catellatospora aurea TaxID=1337874 RepID=A0ABW2GZ00_9ACTN
MSGARTLLPSGDATRCIGAGQCVRTAPDVFDQDDGGTVVVLVAEVDESHRALLDEAAYLCPASAISFTERG